MGTCYTPVPKKLVTLELDNGKKISFMANDMNKAVETCRKHLWRLQQAHGVLVDALSREMLSDVNVA